MGRRSDHSREEQIVMAVEAARDLVEEAGLNGVTARAIARRMGYSAGSLYNLFDNLDGLLHHVNAATMLAMAETVQTAPGDTTDPMTRLQAMGRAYIRYATDNANLWRAVIDHLMAAPGAMPAWYGEQINTLFEIVERELAPYFGPRERLRQRVSARVLWSGVQGVSILEAAQQSVRRTGISAGDMSDLLISTYLAGLESNRKRRPRSR